MASGWGSERASWRGVDDAWGEEKSRSGTEVDRHRCGGELCPWMSRNMILIVMITMMEMSLNPTLCSSLGRNGEGIHRASFTRVGFRTMVNWNCSKELGFGRTLSPYARPKTGELKLCDWYVKWNEQTKFRRLVDDASEPNDWEWTRVSYPDMPSIIPFPIVVGWNVMKSIRTETARSAMTVGIGTEIEGFERTQTMDPVDKVNRRPWLTHEPMLRNGWIKVINDRNVSYPL